MQFPNEVLDQINDWPELLPEHDRSFLVIDLRKDASSPNPDPVVAAATLAYLLLNSGYDLTLSRIAGVQTDNTPFAGSAADFVDSILSSDEPTAPVEPEVPSEPEPEVPSEPEPEVPSDPDAPLEAGV